MAIHLYHLVNTYGYWFMVLGAFLETDTLLIAGGFAANQHLLNVGYLIIIAIGFSMLHDCILFYIGRGIGIKLLNKYPGLEQKMHKASEYIDRYGLWVILILRFAYGLRTLIPIALGMSKISDKKFLFYDFIGGILWSIFFIFGGALFGKAMAVLIPKFQWFGDFDNITIVIALIVFLGMFAGGIYHWIRRIKMKSLFRAGRIKGSRESAIMPKITQEK